ncbi:Fibrous sheath-interacting protein 1 [Borealophlyctis nickersoniae]|nr:Fibrous sheath-interacting protein 1 [Borealophlyctis nickersoniae]
MRANPQWHTKQTPIRPRKQSPLPTEATRSGPSTPIKRVRRSSVKSGGGLTPLPDEDVPTIFLPPEPTLSRSAFRDVPVREEADEGASGDAIAVSGVIEQRSEAEEKSSDKLPADTCNPEQEDQETQKLISDILQRQEKWESTREEVETYLRKLKEAVASGDPEVIAQELRAASAKRFQERLVVEKDAEPAEEDHQIQIQAGLLKIKELDAIIKQKNMLARTLTRDRLSRESSAHPSTRDHPTNANSPHTQLDASDEDDDDDDGDAAESIDIELKSVHSLDTRTFITEPKFGSRVKIGIQALEGGSGGGMHHVAKSAEGPSSRHATKKKGYKQGDFIQRNIVLGPEARFYDAMTEEEKERVEAILNSADLEIEESPESVASSGMSTPFRPFTASTGFFPEPTEYDRLIDIDRKLQLIIPETQWETKSIVWTASSATGTSTPMTCGLWSAPSEMNFVTVRDVETVMRDVDIAKAPEKLLRDEQNLLQEIDEKLQRLEDAPSLSSQDLDRLLYECLRDDAKMSSRASSNWEVEDAQSSRCSSRPMSTGPVQHSAAPDMGQDT